MQSQNMSKFQQIVLIALVIGLALVVRIYRLGHENFWIDEVRQVRIASQTPSEIVRSYGSMHSESHTHTVAPLSPLITHFFISEIDTEYYARLPSAIFSTLGVFALFLFSRQLLPFSTSLLAALFLAFSPIDVWYSQEARWYSQWSVITTLSYLALVRAEKTRSLGAWIGYFLATVANLYTFIYSAFVIAAQAISVTWRQRIGRGSLRTLATFVLACLLVPAATVPVVSTVVGSLSAGTATSGTPRASSFFEFPYTFLAYSAGFTVGPTVTELHHPPSLIRILTEYPELVLVFAVFFPISLLGCLRITREPGLATWLIPWLIVPALLVFLIAIIMPTMTYQVRYTFAAVPAFMLVLAVGVFSFRSRVRWLASGAILVLFCYSLSNFFWAEKYDKADVRGAVAHIGSVDTGPTQLVVVGQIINAMPAYATDPNIKVIHGSGTQQRWLEAVDTSRRVWLVSGRDWIQGRQDKPHCLQLLSASFEASEYTTFTGIELMRLDPRENVD